MNVQAFVFFLAVYLFTHPLRLCDLCLMLKHVKMQTLKQKSVNGIGSVPAQSARIKITLLLSINVIISDV